MAIVLDGLVLGLQLAVLGVGVSLVFGLSGVLDLAYGAKIVVAAVVGSELLGAGGTRWWVLPAVVLVSTLLSLSVDRTVLTPAHKRSGEARVVLSLLMTLAVAFVLDGMVVSLRPHAALSLGVGGAPMEVMGVTMRRGSLVAAGLALVVLVATFLLLQATRLGRAIRCVIQDDEGAQLCGVEPGRVRTLVVVLSGALAGIVAITQGLSSSVSTADGFDLTILAVVVAVVGGLGRVGGAVVAGILLGLVHAVATALLGASITWVVLLSAAALTILVRPEGVLGLEGWRRASQGHASQEHAGTEAT